MYVDYNLLPDNSKVWVYPSSRKFYDTEIEDIQRKINHFITSWKSEDSNFKSSFQFLYQRFIVFYADDSLSTLKSNDLDEVVRFILQLQTDYNIALLDRMNVCFKQGKYVQYKNLKDFKKLVKDKAVTGKTIVFDNLVSTKFDFDNFWEIPIADSWYNRFL